MWRLWTSGRAKQFRFDLGSDHVFLEPFVYASRALMGRLGSKIDCRSIMLDLVYEPHEPRPRPYSAAEIAEIEADIDEIAANP
jgi:hypothetical protein